jgi:hypothetical protein
VPIHGSLPRWHVRQQPLTHCLMQAVECGEDHVRLNSLHILNQPALRDISKQLTTALRQAERELVTQRTAGACVGKLHPCLLTSTDGQRAHQPIRLASCSAAVTTLVIGCCRSSATV